VSTTKDQIDVLLVDDDEEDYLLTKDMLSTLDGARHKLHWVSDYRSALKAAEEGDYDVCLVDYRLGSENGIQLVRELIANGHDLPIILLTGEGDHDVDVEATRAGAADYLVKGELTPNVLERTIRYTMRSRDDLRALRENEEALRQAQKMEAIGSLAAGIAHDFNNLLLVIRGYSAILLKSLDDDKLRGNVLQIDSAAQRAADFTRQLLAFSRQQVLQPELIDPNEVVKETIELVGRMLGEDIELDCELEPQPDSILVDRGQLGQVMLNLIVNARDAMEEGGRLAVLTSNVELDKAYASDHLGVVPGRYVLLQVTDSGPGMDEVTRSRAFDPFFTTKEGGTGLGLATVHGIVKQSGGHIWLYSEPGMGTTFKVYFPIAGESVVSAPPPSEVGSLDGSETILLVEDAELVRGLVSEALESFGYTVLLAASGSEAIALAEHHQGTIDLVLTDVVMPHMNGRELAERLLAEQPGLRVLYTSGYPADTIIRHGIEEARAAFIEKPYVPDELARKVRQVLQPQQ
jgi:two-component system, cell cycle sensor histidine kinase and response regulator CckA